MHKRGPSKSQILCTFQFSHIQWLYISKGILKYRHNFNNTFQAIPVLILLFDLLFKTKVMNLCVLDRRWDKLGSFQVKSYVYGVAYRFENVFE